MYEVHAGGDHFFDFLTINYESVAALCKGIYDFENR